MAEYDDVVARAKATNSIVHFGRIFELCHEKHSELPVDRRKYKGRVVFQGNNVRDQDNNWAVFQEMQSSASLMSASKMVDYFGSLDGHDVEMSDAPGAFTQSELQGDETWITLPHEQWPQSWKSKYRRPVVKLRLALYGHPLAGCCWEQKWTHEVRKVGFEPVPD